MHRLEQHQGDLPALVQGLRPDERRWLARLALSEMAPMQDARQVGSDVELQELWLEAAASRDPGARVALEVHRQVEFARQPAWQAAVSGGDALAVVQRRGDSGGWVKTPFGEVSRLPERVPEPEVVDPGRGVGRQGLPGRPAAVARVGEHVPLRAPASPVLLDQLVTISHRL